MILKVCLRIRRRRIAPLGSPPGFRAGSNGPTSWRRSNLEDTTCKTWMSPGLPKAEIPATTARFMLPMYAKPVYPLHVCSLIWIKDQGQTVNKTILKLMRELKEGGRVEVNIKPVYIFLFRDSESLRLTRPLLPTDSNQQALLFPFTPRTTSSLPNPSDGG